MRESWKGRYPKPDGMGRLWFSSSMTGMYDWILGRALSHTSMTSTSPNKAGISLGTGFAMPLCRVMVDLCCSVFLCRPVRAWISRCGGDHIATKTALSITQQRVRGGVLVIVRR
jgi:hypothetical protein